MRTVSIIAVQFKDNARAKTTELNVTSYSHKQHEDGDTTLTLTRLNDIPSTLTSVVAYRVIEGDLADEYIIEQYGDDNWLELPESPLDRDHFKLDVSKTDLGSNFQWMSKWIELLNTKRTDVDMDGPRPISVTLNPATEIAKSIQDFQTKASVSNVNHQYRRIDDVEFTWAEGTNPPEPKDCPFEFYFDKNDALGWYRSTKHRIGWDDGDGYYLETTDKNLSVEGTLVLAMFDAGVFISRKAFYATDESSFKITVDKLTKSQKDEIKTYYRPWGTFKITPEVKDQIKQRRTITLCKEFGIGMSDDGIIANTHALTFRSKQDPIGSRVYWNLNNLKASIKGNVDFSIGVVKSIEMSLSIPNSNPLVTMEVTVNDIAEEKLIGEIKTVSFFYDKDTDSTYWFLNN